MDLEELGRARYVSLTTFRKDGTPVATPVWAVADGGELYVDAQRFVEGQADPQQWAGHRHRLRHARARRGGAQAREGEARLLDEAGLRRVRKLMSRKYTWQFWVVDVPAALARRGKRPHTAIAVKL